MTSQNQTPRERANHHIQEALKTGVRGKLRDILREAAKEASNAGGNRSDIRGARLIKRCRTASAT